MFFILAPAHDITVQDHTIISSSDPDFTFAGNPDLIAYNANGVPYIEANGVPLFFRPGSELLVTVQTQFVALEFGEANALVGPLSTVEDFLAVQSENPTAFSDWSVFEVTETGLLPYDPAADVSIVGLWPEGLPDARSLEGAKIAVLGSSKLEDLVEENGGVLVQIPSIELFAALQTGVIDTVISTTPMTFDSFELPDYTLFKAELGSNGLYAISERVFVGPDPQPGLLPNPPVDGAIMGSERADSLVGDRFDNMLMGLGRDDALNGVSGNDTLDGGAGNDLIIGGDGLDTAVYSGRKAAHTVSFSEGGNSVDITVEDRRDGGDGVDQLSDVETLRFGGFEGEDWPLSIFSGVALLSEVALREFVEVYIAYFNRAPDAEGLFFYGSAFASGTSLETSAQTFVNSTEYAVTYPPSLSNFAFATEVYQNVLGRTPDQAGLDFWVPLLDSGIVTRGTFIVEVLKGAKAPIPSDADRDFRDQKLLDQAYLEAKTDIGIYFSVTNGMSNVANATSAMETFGGQDLADIEGATGVINDFYANALDPENGEFLLELVGVVDDPFA